MLRQLLKKEETQQKEVKKGGNKYIVFWNTILLNIL